MILSDNRIRELIAESEIVHPANTKLINPASINLRLGNTFLVPKPNFDGFKLGDEVEYERHEVTDTMGFTLKPGEFALATTKEYVDLPTNIAAFVQGRSSIGRIGLTTQNAGFVDPGFHGHITLELVNESPSSIILTPGYPVAQLVFFETHPVTRPYRGKYNNQIEATGSRMHLDKQKV